MIKLNDRLGKSTRLVEAKQIVSRAGLDKQVGGLISGIQKLVKMNQMMNYVRVFH